MQAGKSGFHLMVCVFSFLEVTAVYSPYNPYGYLFPQNGQQQPFMPQNMMQSPVQYQPQEPRITVAQVPTIEHVEQVQMAPNDRKIVLIQNNPDVMAIRVADNAGFVSTEYRRSQIFDPKSETPQVQYAPYQAVAKLQKEVEELKKAIGGVKDAKPASKPTIRSE